MLHPVGHSRFTHKSLRRRPAHQASLSEHDPFLPSAGHGARSEAEKESAEAPAVSASWDSQRDLPVGDLLDLDLGENDYDASGLLISEDEDEDDIFFTQARELAQPRGMKVTGARQLFLLPALTNRMHAAVRLGILWPVVVAETTRSRY